MPELPEVETVCRGLSSKILNLTIKKIEVINYRLRYFIPESILDLMPKRKIKRIIRRSKIGIFLLDGPYNLYFHLGMTGKFIIYEGPYLVNKHDHLIIKLSNGITVIYNDVRKFGYIKLLKKPLDIVPSEFSEPKSSNSYLEGSNKAPFTITNGLFALIDFL